MRRSESLVLNLLACVLLMPSAASAAPFAEPESVAKTPRCERCQATAEGQGGTIRTTVTDAARSVSEAVPRGNPATHGDAPGRRAWKTIEEEMAPACFGNRRDGLNDALCPAAFSCAGEDQLRWWIWQRETQWTRDDNGVVAPPQVGDWRQLPGSFCLGSDDPGIPTIGRVTAQVQSGFRDLPLPVAALQVDPAPTTLVNVPTAFFAGGLQTATFSPTILGTTVTINARAVRWDWTWGDGQVSSTTTPGVPKRPVVSHEYVRAQDHTVSVTTTWAGTFTVPGSGEVFQIRSPAVVQSAPVTVQVREARTQLVDR